MFNKDIAAINTNFSTMVEQARASLMVDLKEQNKLLIDKTKKEIVTSEDKISKMKELMKMEVENLERGFSNIIDVEMNHSEGLRGMLEELETEYAQPQS